MEAGEINEVSVWTAYAQMSSQARHHYPRHCLLVQFCLNKVLFGEHSLGFLPFAWIPSGRCSAGPIIEQKDKL